MKKAVAVLRSAVGAFALGGVVLLAACGGGGGGKAAFVGSWVHYEGKSDIDNFELLNDGKGTLDGEKSVLWKIEKNRFVISSEQLVMSNNYDISNDELTLINDNGDTTLFVKKESAKAFYKSGMKEKDAGNYDNAIAGFTEAIRLDTAFVKAYIGRGEAYFAKKDYDKVVEDYTKAIRLNANLAKAYVGRGEAYFAKGEYDKTVSDYTDALRINPNDSVVQRELVIIKKYNKFTDSRDGKTYKTIEIGGQTWMSQNLDYDIPKNDEDGCYGNKNENCAEYGRLYTWEAAKKACPANFHLPNEKDWTTLTDYVGGLKTAGTKLKSSVGWKDYKNISKSTDEFGFSALPGGFYVVDQDGEGESTFRGADEYTVWWSSTPTDINSCGSLCAWRRLIQYQTEDMTKDEAFRMNKYSVRCVQNK